MPSELKCIIYEARNLPIMEKSRNRTDAYCELLFGKAAMGKTETVYNNLCPKWNQAIISFEIIDDEELLEKFIVIKVKDEDVIDRDDVIGTVNIDLSSLLNLNSNKTLKCWFPIYDIQQGIRGELLVEVKLTFVRDESIAKTLV